MIGLGTLINAGAIIIGSIFGVLLKNNLKDNYKLIMIQGVGIVVVVLGVGGAMDGLDATTAIIVILSLMFGGIIGTFFRIGERLNAFGDKLQKRFASEKSQFSKGFIDASLIFCVGAMAILGSIQDGMTGNYDTLLIKAVLDGITSMVLASRLGIGVMFSFVPVMIYQGSITVLSAFLGNFIPIDVQTQITIVGSILIIGIGLDLLEIKKIKIADLLPAILIPIIYYYIKMLVLMLLNT